MEGTLNISPVPPNSKPLIYFRTMLNTLVWRKHTNHYHYSPPGLKRGPPKTYFQKKYYGVFPSFLQRSLTRYTIYYGHFLLKVDFEIPNKSIKTSISYTLGSGSLSIDEIQNIETDYQNSWLINGRFTTISGHFFGNYLNTFHKIDVQTVILRGLKGLNHNWFKSYDTKRKYFRFRVFAIL